MKGQQEIAAIKRKEKANWRMGSITLKRKISNNPHDKKDINEHITVDSCIFRIWICYGNRGV